MEKQAANIILGVKGPGTRFTIKYLGMPFHLKIDWITTERLIKISGELGQVNDIPEGETGTMFQGLMQHVPDAVHICNAIAYATGTPFQKIVSRAILKLPLKDVRTLFDVVRQYADPEAFFFTLGSAKRLSLFKTIQEKS